MTTPGPVWPPTDVTNPFALTVDDVHRLVPYRPLPSAPEGAYPPGTRTTTEADIAAWIAQLSGDLMGRLALAAGIFEVDLTAYTQVWLTCRDAVCNGVASYWEAAYYPERAGVNDTTYSGVLWQRYLRSVESLTDLLGTIIERGGSGTDGGTDGGPIYVPGAGWISSLFPPVAIPDTIKW